MKLLFLLSALYFVNVHAQQVVSYNLDEFTKKQQEPVAEKNIDQILKVYDCQVLSSLQVLARKYDLEIHVDPNDYEYNSTDKVRSKPAACLNKFSCTAHAGASKALPPYFESYAACTPKNNQCVRGLVDCMKDSKVAYAKGTNQKSTDQSIRRTLGLESTNQ